MYISRLIIVKHVTILAHTFQQLNSVVAFLFLPGVTVFCGVTLPSGVGSLWHSRKVRFLATVMTLSGIYSLKLHRLCGAVQQINTS